MPVAQELCWACDGWRHTMTLEGRLWRWRAECLTGDVRDPQKADFGLFPGGVFVAILGLQEQIARNHCSRCGNEVFVCSRCDREMESETAVAGE